MSSLPNQPSSPQSTAAAPTRHDHNEFPEYPTLHNSRWDLLSDFWYAFADSTRNSLHLNAIPWNRVGVLTVIALVLAGIIDWYLPGSQLGMDVGLTLLVGISAIVGYSIRAGGAPSVLDSTSLSSTQSSSSPPTKPA